MADYNYLSDGRPAGTTLGNSAADLVSLHGVAPVAQAAFVAQISTSAGVTGAVGFTATQAAAILANINSLTTALINKGILASS